MSFADLERKKIDKYSPRAVFLVHIGGHIAFEVERIAQLCESKGIVLLEDHASPLPHGAAWNDVRPGSWGDAGIWSFAPTKTISTGEGGMLVSKHAEVLELAQGFRNYGKPTYAAAGSQLSAERVHRRRSRRFVR